MKQLILLLSILLFSVPAFAVPTTLSAVQVSETATVIADNAADTSNGNRVSNPNGDLFFVLRNTENSNSATVTITAQRTSFFQPGLGPVTKSDLVVTLAANAIRHVGPFPKLPWNDGSGYVVLAASGTASSSVKISPLRVLRP